MEGLLAIRQELLIEKLVKGLFHLVHEAMAAAIQQSDSTSEQVVKTAGLARVLLLQSASLFEGPFWYSHSWISLKVLLLQPFRASHLPKSQGHRAVQEGGGHLDPFSKTCPSSALRYHYNQNDEYNFRW